VKTLRIGIVLGMLLTLGFTNVGTARTANLSMTTPAKVGLNTATVNATTLAPSGCSAIAAGLTAVVAAGASGNTSGTNANELVLGRPQTANYTLNGAGGVDCVVGGRGTGGRETLQGGAGSGDVCIGNGFTGAALSDSFNANCETQIP